MDYLSDDGSTGNYWLHDEHVYELDVNGIPVGSYHQRYMQDSLHDDVWRAGSEEEPVRTYGQRRCRSTARYCLHKPACKAA